MADNRLLLTGLPHLALSNIIYSLDRASSNALSFTNRYLHNFITSDDTFFDKWPLLDVLFSHPDRREVVHLTISLDNKKLCAVIREYNKDGTMIVFDIKKGTYKQMQS